MGKLGLAFSLGIMAGPMTGGVVAEKFGDRMVAFTASALSMSTVIMVQLFLPKNTKSEIKKEAAVSGTLDVIIPLRSISQGLIQVNDWGNGLYHFVSFLMPILYNLK